MRRRRPPPPLRRRWRQKSLLTALGLVFAVSAILRLGSLDAAFAEVRRSGDDGAPGAADPGPAPERDSMVFAALQAAFSDLDGLRAELAAREAEVEDRERAVATGQTLLAAQIETLTELEARLSALIAVSDEAAADDLDRLTRVYETMDAEDAAALFTQMEPHFAAGFLARMTPASGAAILAEIDTETAYAISVVMATRNASAPTFAAPGTDPTAPPETQ